MDELDTDRLGALIRAFVAAVCEIDAPSQIREEIGAFLDRHGVAPRDRPTAIAQAERQLAYRRMVHRRLRDVIEEFLPRTCELLGATRLRSEFEEFMAARAPHSVYFREVPGEFIEWGMARWEADSDLPAFLVDVARHELLDAEIGNALGGGEAPSGQPLAVARPVQLDGSARLVRFAFAVQRGEDPPAQVPTALLGYRDRASHTVRLLELSPRAAAICERLLRGDVLEAAIRGGCAAVGESVDDALLTDMASLLADLCERGVILGGMGAVGVELIP